MAVELVLTLRVRSCGFGAEHYKEIGWKPKYSAQHIIESANEEIAFILKYILGGDSKQETENLSFALDA